MTDLDGLDSERRIVTQNLIADLDGLVPFLLGVADRLADGHGIERSNSGRFYCPLCEGFTTDPSWRCSSVRQAEGIRAMVAEWQETLRKAKIIRSDYLAGALNYQDRALRILTGMYANMPGYRPEWGLG